MDSQKWFDFFPLYLFNVLLWYENPAENKADVKVPLGLLKL